MLETRCSSLSPDSSGVLTHSFRAVTHLPTLSYFHCSLPVWLICSDDDL